MSRLLTLPALIVCALALSAFQAEPGYAWKPPAGWTVTDDGGTPLLTTYTAPDGTTNCNVQSNPVPALEAFTQDQLNSEMSTPFQAAGWANLLAIKPSDVTVLATESRAVDTYRIEVGTYDIAANAMGVPIPVRVRMAAIYLVGRVVIAGCYSTIENYPQVETVFEQAVSSLRPR